MCINLEDKNSKRTHWVSFFIDRNKVIYFDSFGTEYIYKNILNKFTDKSITHNIQDNESFMCGCYCFSFIEYMLAGKSLIDHTNLLSRNHYKKIDKIIYKYFEDEHVRRSKSLV